MNDRGILHVSDVMYDRQRNGKLQYTLHDFLYTLHDVLYTTWILVQQENHIFTMDANLFDVNIVQNSWMNYFY